MMLTGEPKINRYYSRFAYGLDGATHPVAVTWPNLSTTLVALQLGQSMNAQYSNFSYPIRHPDHLYQYLAGDGTLRWMREPCFGQGSPPLVGSWFSQFADRIIDAGHYTDVIQCLIGIGGTLANQWGPSGEFNSVLIAACLRMKDAGLIPTYIGCGQGVTECFLDMDGFTFWLPNWKDNVDISRSIFGIEVPWFFERQTLWCHPDYTIIYPYGKTSASIRTAQLAITTQMSKVFQGPDTDAFTLEYRWDKQHWAQSGCALASAAWADVINAHTF